MVFRAYSLLRLRVLQVGATINDICLDGMKQFNLLCIYVGAFWEQNDLFGFLLLDGFVKVEHVINDLDVLRPVPLNVDVPSHGQDPADAGDPPHPVLQNQFCIVIWSRVVETSPEKVPISPESLQ